MAETQGSSRRRRRASRPAGAPPAAQTTPALPDAATPPVQPESRAAAPKPRRRPRDAESGLRELVGGGSSQVGVEGALRARDVNRPTEDDLRAAERDVVVVRRHWTPPTS